jgi:hypothetical protein
MKKLILIVSFGALVACNGGTKSTTTQAVEQPVTEQVADGKQYACPMKCEGDKTYAEAGTCPVCKMDLKEVAMAEADTTHAGHDH